MGQEGPAPAWVPPKDAALRRIKAGPPEYPSTAQAARIQGNVILEIGIDETGTASVRRLVTGHPMLVPAAARAVSGWKYRPFEISGKPARVVTFVTVTFEVWPSHGGAVAGHAEMLIDYSFWSALEAAQAALAKGDYAGSEEQLMRAKEAVPPEISDVHHMPEQWQWITTMGRRCMAQQKFDAAEGYYREALALRVKRSDDKDTPELAASFANLGNLFIEEKKPDLARENFDRSIAIYQKNFKGAGSGNPAARQVYGRAVAYQSWALFALAKQRNDAADSATECGKLLDFQEFLRVPDRESYVAACKQIAPVAAKP